MPDTKENVGVGWHPIVERLERVLRQLDPDYEVVQIKEKFGGLRYYFTTSPGIGVDTAWAMQAVTSQAEHDSFNICEECGQRGFKVSIGHYIRTLCENDTAAAWSAWAVRQQRLKESRDG